MRHKGVNKEETRRRMVEAVSRGFRKHGYAGIGVDRLAKDSGVTSGAFYAHFGSKNGAFEVALKRGFDEVIERLPQLQSEQGGRWVEAFADYYLGKSHREDRECGCAMAALTPEVVRSEPASRAAFETKMDTIVGCVAEGLEGNDLADTRARAWAMLGILIGGLNIVRSLNSEAAIQEAVAAIKRAAIAVAGPVRTDDTLR